MENAQRKQLYSVRHILTLQVSSTLVSELDDCDCLFVQLADGSKRPICEMYSASTAEVVKDEILQSFMNPSGHIRIVIATIAFGMGLDAPDVRQSIHFGPSDSIQAYVQETGRCGRDGINSVALLYYRNKDLSKASSASDSIKAYCTNLELWDGETSPTSPEPLLSETDSKVCMNGLYS